MYQAKLFPLLIFLLLTNTANGQGENNIWTLSRNLILDFNHPNQPRCSTIDHIFDWMGMASVCDKNGKLLFYTNGDTVWTKDHTVMPNGLLLQSPSSALQEALIVPSVHFPSQYYLFIRNDSDASIIYNLIDLNLNNGLGDIVENQKNILLDKDMGTGMAAFEGDDCSIWVVFHRIDTSLFITHKIDANGLNMNPVLSKSGFSSGKYTYYVCPISITTDYSYLSIGSEDNNIELHSINTSTGQIYNPVIIDHYNSSGRILSTCFSPNGMLLYISGGPTGDDIIQYNISDLKNITSQKINNDSTYVNGCLRLGPDNKIYTDNWEGIYTILKPNVEGPACQFSTSYVQIPNDGKTSPSSLGNNVIVKRKSIENKTYDSIACVNNIITINENKKGYWEQGDTASVRFFSKSQTAIYTSVDNCIISIDTFHINIQNCDCNIFIPSAFTPNNDGKNDAFKIMADDIISLQVRIYNRYGQLVFMTASPEYQWDGNRNGKECEIGTYYYEMTAKCRKGQEVYKKGDVLLIR